MIDEALIRRFFAGVNAREREIMSAVLHPEAGFDFPKTEPLVGRERILRFFDILFRKFPELSFELVDIIREGEQAAVHWRNAGRDRRGAAYANEGVTWLRCEGGQIRYISDYFKNTEAF